MWNIPKSLWMYRGFILGSVKREFQSKYQNSLLGAAWNVLNPLSMIIIYTVIFSKIMHSRLSGDNSIFSYSIYLCAGIFSWGLFAEIVGRAQNTFIENANLLKKISFPRICLPVIVVANSLVNFFIIFGLFTIFLLLSGNFPGTAYFGLMPVLFILVVFAIGLGISLGVLNVFFRDVGQSFSIILQFWFWLTPIVYPGNVLPKYLHSLMKYNPMANIISACQNILVHGYWPVWQGLLPVAILSVILCIIGMRLYRKHVGEMVDEL